MTYHYGQVAAFCYYIQPQKNHNVRFCYHLSPVTYHLSPQSDK